MYPSVISFFVCLLVLQKYKSECGTIVTRTMQLTVGIYAPECTKQVGDTVSIFCVSFHE